MPLVLKTYRSTTYSTREESPLSATVRAERCNVGNGDAALIEQTAPSVCIPIGMRNATRDPRQGDPGTGVGKEGDKAFAVTAGGTVQGVAVKEEPMGDCRVRRLTPKECERLQGFPDDWTRIPYRGKPEDKCPDAPRYKAIGNSWAVPVVRWIGERIQREIEEIGEVGDAEK